MRRLVIDTNLYIDWLNAGRHEAILFQPDAVKYLSAVVMMELLAGARAARDQRLLRGITETFARAGRILLPSVAVYEEAGYVLRRLHASWERSLAGASSLVSDVLIALSARSIGATVITQNERDFVAIQKIRPFKLAVVE
jgi:predicted nucleic acid-binding protein